LLKLRQLGTYGVKMKGSFLAWLVRWAGRLPVQEIFILPWLLWSAQYKIFFFLNMPHFNFYVSPSPSDLGSLSCRAAGLSMCVYGHRLKSIVLYRDGIFKLLRSTGTNSKESIPPAYVAWRAGTTTLLLLGS
jgi:hypothetical protein